MAGPCGHKENADETRRPFISGERSDICEHMAGRDRRLNGRPANTERGAPGTGQLIPACTLV
jgi:hypothetical protein